ncbi:Uncharacterised protein [Mycobacterium tuberculosis]|uniref:Uncharacterized protein n=1 Tax=Mycobacterium tuberculosis TaxID=1773 RepID=A0A0U0TCS3_MYCTX|nr:Uncharacterised protein [Mycobacterium tuberculosis]
MPAAANPAQMRRIAAAATSTATSRSVTPGSASSTSSPPAPSTRVNRPGRSRSAISRTI